MFRSRPMWTWMWMSRWSGVVWWSLYPFNSVSMLQWCWWWGTWRIYICKIQVRGMVCFYIIRLWLWFMVFNATLSNISVISWWSALMVVETGVPGKSNRPVTRHWLTFSHNDVLSKSHLSGIQTHSISGDRHWFIV